MLALPPPLRLYAFIPLRFAAHVLVYSLTRTVCVDHFAARVTVLVL